MCQIRAAVQEDTWADQDACGRGRLANVADNCKVSVPLPCNNVQYPQCNGELPARSQMPPMPIFDLQPSAMGMLMSSHTSRLISTRSCLVCKAREPLQYASMMSFWASDHPQVCYPQMMTHVQSSFKKSAMEPLLRRQVPTLRIICYLVGMGSGQVCRD